MIGKLLGLSGAASQIGGAITDVSEVFTTNATRKMEAGNRAYLASLDQYGREFRTLPLGRFDRLINGLNRLPRPMLALGTIGLFVYAMAAPQSFSLRMQGLTYVPDPLWWLLGAVVSFYFGARELSYARAQSAGMAGLAGGAPMVRGQNAPANPALEEWQARSHAGQTTPPVPVAR